MTEGDDTPLPRPPDRGNQSPFERFAYLYLERGYSVIPIAPGTKRPGAWTEEHGWRGMSDWERFAKRQATDIELSFWYRWPDAGIGVLLGKLSGIVALDRDYDTRGTDALDALIPWTPVKKRGKKGYTAFFRYNGEASRSFNINGMRVLDVLADGRQTLMPGTMHPDGIAYHYLTEDTLESYDAEDLPVLPADFFERVERTLAPFQTEEDRKFTARPLALRDDGGPINTERSYAAQYYSDLNRTALQHLDRWVERLIPGVRRERDGWRCTATWRKCERPNVGIHPSGIFDFGGNYGMTAIDLVMNANQVDFGRAADALRELLPMQDDDIAMTVGGRAMQEAAAPAAAPAPQPAGAPAPPAVLPWLRPAPSREAPPAVMLPPTSSVDPAPALPWFILNPPGILGDIARWITASAPKRQPELALGAALALCSVVMGRTYKTDFDNWTMLYVILIAKSTEGKEYPQQAVQNVLAAADLAQLIGGSGYTSQGAVFSALELAPAHLAVIDEIGKMLKVSRAKGNSNGEAAIDKLVEIYGKPSGIVRPPTYSTMTAPKGVSAAMANRVVHSPSITLLGATTQNTFYENLTDDLVKDGFLGRCLVVETTQPRQLTRFVERPPAPQKIIDWCKAVHASNALAGDLAGLCPPDMPPSTIELKFSEACRPMLERMELKLMAEKDAVEADGLDVLLGRTLEKAMRVSLIAAKAEDINARTIEARHLEWAMAFCHYLDSALVRAVYKCRSANEHDADMKRMLRYVGDAKKYASDKHFAEELRQGFMPHSKLLKLMKMPARKLTELVDTAIESKQMLRSGGPLQISYALPPD